MNGESALTSFQHEMYSGKKFGPILTRDINPRIAEETSIILPMIRKPKTLKL